MGKAIKCIISAILSAVIFEGGICVDTVRIGEKNLNVINPISGETETAEYDRTWNRRLTLRENQKRLIEVFINNCVADVGKECREEFLHTLEEIIRSPVGCKLLRTLAAKCGSDSDGKITVLPQQEIPEKKIRKKDIVFLPDDDGYFLLFGGANIRIDSLFFMLRSDEKGGYILKKKTLSSDVILFHEMLHWLHAFEKRQQAGTPNRLAEMFAAMAPERYRKIFYDKIFDEFCCPELSNKETDKQNFDLFRFLCCEQNFSFLFRTAEEYRTMLGISDRGFDMLNEATYSLSSSDQKKSPENRKKYKRYIRMLHVTAAEPITEAPEVAVKYPLFKKNNIYAVSEKKNHLTKEEYSEEMYCRLFGDEDLCNFYLSPDSQFEMPLFGVEDFEVSDINPETVCRRLPRTE
jgi:hypothetical protein